MAGGRVVVTATIEPTQHVQGGLRPMDPVQDLGTVADLIANGFGAEIDERGRAALREMRWMARLTPLLWWWTQADPSFQDTFNGFVWEEPAPEGRGLRIVANVSLSPAPGSRRRRIICNVVVEDAYRGQGIGRRLVEAAIGEAQALGAQGVLLQVHRDNTPALQLYVGLGFREVSGETELRLDSVSPVVVQDAPGYRVRPWRAADGQAAYDLARLGTSPSQQWIRPLRREEYHPDWLARFGRWISELLAGQRTWRLAALHEERLVAVVEVTAAFRQGEHRLTLLVHPEHAGRLEAAMVSRALHWLSDLPSRSVRIPINADQKAILQVLRDYGFEEQRTLLTMRKEFE
ncbi:MAG: GNAT family N-acetyltransferase [Anaerolineae bacterium]